MSAASDRAAATAARFSRPAPTAAAGDGPRPDDDPQVSDSRRGNRPPATDDVRSTVDLGPAHHHQLGEWQLDVAWQLGVKGRVVSRQLVLEQLVRELLVDETLRRKIHARIAAELAARKGEK